MPDMNRVNEVIRLTREGKTLRQMADILGVSDTAVYDARIWAIRNGLFPDYKDPRREYSMEYLVKLFKEGLSNPEIAEKLGTNTPRVARWRMQARRQGLLPAFKTKSCYGRAGNLLKYTAQRVGTMRECLDGLPEQVITWLVRETPDGANVADTIRGIIQDAYDDEQDRKKAKRAA